MARADEVGEVARLQRPCAGAFCSSADAVGEATERVGAGAGLDDVPNGLVGTGLVRPAKAATAEGGYQAGQHQRGLARAAVAGDQHEGRPAQEDNQLIGLPFAAEEEMRRAAVIGPQADEGLALDGEPGARLEPNDSQEQLPELLRPLGIADPLVLREEARQVCATGARRQDRHDRVARLPMGAVQGDADLVPYPVHYAAAADIDGEGRGAGQSGLQFILPATAGSEVGLVNPDPVRPGLPARLQMLSQAEGGLAVNAGVGQEQAVGRFWRHGSCRPAGVVLHLLLLEFGGIVTVSDGSYHTCNSQAAPYRTRAWMSV